MKKYISKAELISMGACKECLGRFIEQTSNTDEPVLIESLFNGKNTVADLIWLSGRTCTIEKIRKFTRDIALINIELIKQYCSEADYSLILNFLKTGENAAAAHAAVYAAAIAAVYAAARAAVYVDAVDAVYAARAAVAAVAAVAARVTVYTACDAYVDGKIDFTPYLQELFS